MEERKNKKKSKYAAPVIQVDTIATEHQIAANSERPLTKESSSENKNDKEKDNPTDKDW